MDLGTYSLATLAEIRSWLPGELLKTSAAGSKKHLFKRQTAKIFKIYQNAKKNALLALKVTKNAKRHFPKISDIWTPKTSRFGVFATIWSH